ncbi:MAG: saccharopine dehydrogenase NADP-binding domain-containing protein [Pseudomonadota bacterium]
MKVVIVGGYGVFGSLTARLLVRDGHQLWLAGRHPEKARALAQELGAQTIAFDITTAQETLFAIKPDVVIDAAGPFQHYGNDPYRLPRLCIAHGCHYLDLSDSTAFTQGIATLNTEAVTAGVFALSGASSVPGLSSCIVGDLIQGLDDVDLIDIAILPGNRAPRGMSVIKSIVSGVGRPHRTWRNRTWQTATGWTDRKLYHLAPGLSRAAYRVDVPDLTLLPDITGARSVEFRAGLELPIMNWALHGLAKLRRYTRFDLPDIAYRALHAISRALYPFGSDRGGMQVHVSGTLNGQSTSRTWTLIAKRGHGPFVPGVMCRALLRNPKRIRTGARPCLAELPRASVEHAMQDLALQTKIIAPLDHGALAKAAKNRTGANEGTKISVVN